MSQFVSNLVWTLAKTKLYLLISVWMTLMLTPSHRVTGKLELCSHAFVQLHEVTKMFMMVDC